MGKINSKQKGARFERTLAGLLKAHGFDTHRSAQYCGNTGDAADVVGLPYIHIEAKHQEKMSLYDWMSQAVHDALHNDENPMPVVMHKKNNHGILVTMLFDDWMTLYKEYYESREDEMTVLKCKLDKDAFLPTRAHDDDAGLDIRAKSNFVIEPHSIFRVGTGVHIQLKDHYEAQVLGRSSLSAKGIQVFTGVIDSGYRGEIGIVMHNTNGHKICFTRGDKIAQLVINRVDLPAPIEVDELSESERGEGGFGSTGR